MNGVFNSNFMLGFLLAKDRPRDEAVSTGLQLSQMPANNPVGTVLLKKQVDRVTELETQVNVGTNEITRLRKLNAELTEELRKLKPNPEDSGDTFQAYQAAVSDQVKGLFREFQVPGEVSDDNKPLVEEAVYQLGNAILKAVQNPPVPAH